MAGNESTTSGLLTQAHELVKQFVIYDAQDRTSEVFTAPTNAGHGTPCTKVTYVYRNSGSSQVERMKEENAVWDSSYDIP